MLTGSRCSVVLLLVAVLSCGVGAQSHSPLISRGCLKGTDFEAEGYRIRQIRVKNPFSFLPWVRARVRQAQSGVADLPGTPFTYARIQKVAAELEDREFLPESSEERLRFSIITTSVENCSDKQLDVSWFVFSSQVSPSFSSTSESLKSEQAAPQREAGADPSASHWHLEPTAGYNATDRLFGGGRLTYRTGVQTVAPFTSLSFEGLGSATTHQVEAEASGSTNNAHAWLDHAEWRLHFANSAEPVDQFDSSFAGLTAQFSGTSKPLTPLRLPIRFAAQIGGGSVHSNFPLVELAPGTIASTRFGSAKFAVGTTKRFDRGAVEASYGIELGSTGAGAHIDWTKHIADVRWELSFPFGDHRAIDLESRVTGGLLLREGVIPAGMRFFGGNRETFFLPNDDWEVRTNPFIRSLPANRMYQTTSGAGGDEYIAYNLTASIVTWRLPLVPPELSNDKEFTDQLSAQMQAATSFLETDYLAEDPSFQEAFSVLPDVAADLGALSTSVTAAEKAHPGEFPTEFKRCNSAINIATRRTKAAQAAKGGSRYGDVAALLSVDADEDRLRKVESICIEALNGTLGDVSIAAHGSDLEVLRSRMEAQFKQIDSEKARTQAQVEMRDVRRTLTSLISEVNTFSLSPVAAFDVATLSPSGGSLGTRVGIGGGVRFTIVNAVDFTFGYSAGVRRLPSEPRGALFFTMHLRDLYR